MDLDEYKKLIMNIYNGEEEISWVPAVSPAKEKMLAKLAANTNKSCDISSLKKSEVESKIIGCNLIYCDKFTLKLYGEEKYTVKLYEHKNQTPNGISCSIDVVVDVPKDNRFHNSSWITLFRGKTGYGLNMEDVVNICKWLISINKLSAFI